MGSTKIVVTTAVLLMLAGFTPAQEQTWTLERAGDVAALGWSQPRLDEVHRYADSIGTAALIVITDDRTVAAWGRTSHRFRAHSMRKSFLSALMGIAVARGEVDTAATLADLDVNDRNPLTDEERRATVLQLMQSRSGVYHPAASETAEMRAGRLRRGEYEPGSHWHYNNWDFNTIGTIYSQLTGRPVGDAFFELIAARVGMEDFSAADVRYQFEPDASEHAAYKFRITARDLARFGLLYLHAGAWGGEQVISAKWISDSTRVHSRTGEAGTKSGYGLMWWVTADAADGLPAGSYTASGSGGQRLTILPHINTVIVHLMDTDEREGPRIGTRAYNELLRRLLAARED
jgi:CubicO group peptidase (beta-lactamase class C family)